MRGITLGFLSALVACDATMTSADDQSKKSCGNGVCQGGESCSSCPADCGTCEPPPPDAGTPSSFGTTPTIACPSGAIDIALGDDIPATVNAYPGGTTFCIHAGTHYTSAPINPKSYDVLIGEYGATIDGAAVTMTYDVGSTSIIRGWNCTGCDHVTVRNLVVKNLAGYNCIGMYNGGDDWVVDHNEASGCKFGINTGTRSHVTNNYVHDHLTYAMGGFVSVGTVIDHNEIAHSGGTPDAGGSTACTKWGGIMSGDSSLTITNNYVHDCYTTALWLDGAGTNNVIAYNRIENNFRGGIEWEVSLSGSVHDNTLTGNDVAVFISNSSDVEIYNNTITQTTGMALELFYDASRLPLANNYFHDNQVDLTGHAASIANGLSCINTSSCQSYGTPNNNRFDHNHYNTGGRTGSPFWMWASGGLSWSQWQAIPEDANGSVL